MRFRCRRKTQAATWTHRRPVSASRWWVLGPHEEPPPITPDTKITIKPPAKTHDRTPTIKFKATAAGASYQCKLDGKPFKPCRSPFTTKTLSFGRHTLKIKASVGGIADPSPATVSFKVVRG